jgi:cytochrome c553
MNRTHTMLLVVITVAVFATGCRPSDEPNYDYLPWINHMLRSSAAESQMKAPGAEEGKPVFDNGRVLQHPPEGTIPHGWNAGTAPGNTRRAFGWKAEWLRGAFAETNEGRELAGKTLTNPYDGELSWGGEEAARGEDRFNTFCAPCHGKDAAGQGPVVARKVGVPEWNLHREGENGPTTWSDGYLYHIVTHGRGMMGSYASQVAPLDRWRIIKHLRKLQADYKKKAAAAPRSTGEG